MTTTVEVSEEVVHVVETPIEETVTIDEGDEISVIEVDSEPAVVVTVEPEIQVVEMGLEGPQGAGVVPGGDSGEGLLKTTAADFDTAWGPVETPDGATTKVAAHADAFSGHFFLPGIVSEVEPPENSFGGLPFVWVDSAPALPELWLMEP